jgi:acyl-CoA hydrolase
VTEPLDPRPATASETLISEVMEIQHANNAGFVHGGTIMRLVDNTAGIAAAKHSRRRVVTAVMDEMSFVSPVYIGDVVTLRATVNDAHRTSMEVGVRVDAETIRTGEIRHVSTAYLVFVGLDDDGRPTAVPPVRADTPAQRRRQQQARVRREQRLIRKAAVDRAGVEAPSDGSS